MSSALYVASFGNFLVWVVWIGAALGCLGSGVAVISFSNPFYSALALIGNLASLAVLYLLASAEFVAAAQVLVYAGAVMVMFLFVIAYLGGRADAPWAGGPRWLQLSAVVAGLALLVEVVVALLWKSDDARPRAADRLVVRQPGGDRPAVPHRSPARLRDHLDRAPGRRRRRRRARYPGHRTADGAGVIGPNVPWYLAVSGILFGIGAVGVMLRRSPLIVLLSLEIMLNAGNLALVGFSRYWGATDGQVFAIAVMAVAASEVCVGLGLIVAMARKRLALDVDELTELHG